MTEDPLLPLWHKHRRGDRVAMNELLRQLDPHIKQRVSFYRDVPIPSTAIEAHAKRRALQALDSFDPKVGAQLATHVVNALQGVSRFVNQHKNIARIPEHRALKIGLYESAHGQLEALHGRPPSIEELADHLGWSQQETQLVRRSMRSKALSASMTPDDVDVTHYDRMRETMMFVRAGLLVEEREAFDYLYGLNGKPQLSVAETAKKLKLSADKLYRLLRTSADQIRRYS